MALMANWSCNSCPDELHGDHTPLRTGRLDDLGLTVVSEPMTVASAFKRLTSPPYSKLRERAVNMTRSASLSADNLAMRSVPVHALFTLALG